MNRRHFLKSMKIAGIGTLLAFFFFTSCSNNNELKCTTCAVREWTDAINIRYTEYTNCGDWEDLVEWRDAFYADSIVKVNPGNQTGRVDVDCSPIQ